MHKVPKISLLLPVRNGEQTLKAAVLSLLSQTEPDFELVIVDDNSTDSSVSLSASLAKEDSRVRVLRSPGVGIAAALRHGFYSTNGRYVARMDCDDISEPERLELQAQYLDATPGVGVVATCVKHCAGDTASEGMAEFVSWNNSLLSSQEIYQARFIESPLVHPSVMFRREVGSRFGLWLSGSIPEDYELWLRWMESGVRFAKLPQELLQWVDSPRRASRISESYSVESFYRVKSPYLARYIRRKNSLNRSLMILGAGREARKRVRYLMEHGIRIHSWIDVDPKKIGRYYEGSPVIALSELPRPQDAMVLYFVSSRGQRGRSEELLRSFSYRNGSDYISCA